MEEDNKKKRKCKPCIFWLWQKGYILLALLLGILILVLLLVFPDKPGSSTLHLKFDVQPPSTAHDDTAFSPTVVVGVYNSNNVLVTSSTALITLDSAPTSGILNGTVNVTAISGQATFTSVSATGSAGTYTLIATSPGITSSTSTSFVLGP